MAMLRHRVPAESEVPARLLCVVRGRRTDVIYRDELERLAAAATGFEVVHTLTRRQPPGWTGLRAAASTTRCCRTSLAARARPASYVCGPTRLVEAAAAALVALGHEPATIGPNASDRREAEVDESGDGRRERARRELGEVLVGDATTAVGVCGACGASGELGAVHVFAAAGAVARCPACGEVLFVVVEAGGRVVLGVERLRRLELRSGA